MCSMKTRRCIAVSSSILILILVFQITLYLHQDQTSLDENDLKIQNDQVHTVEKNTSNMRARVYVYEGRTRRQHRLKEHAEGLDPSTGLIYARRVPQVYIIGQPKCGTGKPLPLLFIYISVFFYLSRKCRKPLLFVAENVHCLESYLFGLRTNV